MTLSEAVSILARAHTSEADPADIARGFSIRISTSAYFFEAQSITKEDYLEAWHVLRTEAGLPTPDRRN